MPMVGDGACLDPVCGCLRQRQFHTTDPGPGAGPGRVAVRPPPAVGVVSGAVVQALAAGLADRVFVLRAADQPPGRGAVGVLPGLRDRDQSDRGAGVAVVPAVGVRRRRVPARGWWSPWPLTAMQARERVLAVLYEKPGPDGFGVRRMARVLFDDALDELAASDGPTSNDAARERIRHGLRRGHGLGAVVTDEPTRHGRRRPGRPGVVRQIGDLLQSRPACRGRRSDARAAWFEQKAAVFDAIAARDPHAADECTRSPSRPACTPDGCVGLGREPGPHRTTGQRPKASTRTWRAARPARPGPPARPATTPPRRSSGPGARGNAPTRPAPEQHQRRGFTTDSRQRKETGLMGKAEPVQVTLPQPHPFTKAFPTAAFVGSFIGAIVNLGVSRCASRGRSGANWPCCSPWTRWPRWRSAPWAPGGAALCR